MGTLYIDTGGSVDNSGSTDQNAANLTGTAATVAGAVVSLDGTPDLSGLITSGATQSSINIAGATNVNTTIFWITAFDNGAGKTVTVTPSPTGVTSNAWKIGGRHVLTNARIEAALRAGDTAIFNNSPAAQAAAHWTFRIAGDVTSGQAKIKGKTGVRPVLNGTSTNSVISFNSLANCWAENLELDQDGASGNVASMDGIAGTLYNVKISDGGGHGVRATAVANKIIACEISGVLGDGVNDARSGLVLGCYIHDVAGNGINVIDANAACSIVNNVIDTCTGRGIYLSLPDSNQNAIKLVIGNTVYNCGNSGIEMADADINVVLINDLCQDNGNAAGESNVEWAAGNSEAVSFHGWNLFYNNSGADAPINYTLNATELTTDPLMTAPSTGDFSLGSSSPAKATGFPGQLLGTNLSYLDIGAVQRQESSPPLTLMGAGLM